MRQTRPDSQLVVGRKPVWEALLAGKRMERILIQEGLHQSPDISSLAAEARKQKITLFTVPQAKLNSLTRRPHQGVAAILALVEYFHPEDLLMQAYDKGKTPVFVMLDRVTDVGNFGAICRTAELTGVDGVIIPSRGGALVNEGTVKASAGAALKIPLSKIHSFSKTIDFFQLNGLAVYAADGESKLVLSKVDLTIPHALIFGAEGEGVDKSLLPQCNAIFRIPMIGTLDSYNVSVAAGITLYEMMRQRNLTS